MEKHKFDVGLICRNIHENLELVNKQTQFTNWLAQKNSAYPRSSTLPILYQPVLSSLPEHVAHTTSFPRMCCSTRTDQLTSQDHLGSFRSLPARVTHASARRFSGFRLADSVPYVIAGRKAVCSSSLCRGSAGKLCPQIIRQ